MRSMKGKLARRVIKSTAKHSARRATSTLQRKPMRTTTILAIGVGAGVVIGVLVGRANDGEARTVSGLTAATDGEARTVSGLTAATDGEARTVSGLAAEKGP